MGNKAVITTRKNFTINGIGIYLHWNGGRDSVEAFLTYCKMRDFCPPEKDSYGWARLCQVIANFFGGDSSIGIDQVNNLDCNNHDNGVYFIKDWEIEGRAFFEGTEQKSHRLFDMLNAIDEEQPEDDRLGEKAIDNWLNHGTLK